ncbi:zinc ribbon domain-containing protein [Streptomyces sp. NPDC005859]|uniref:Zn-ribbon domain-containing OB-fold protein n=1 Tax=Streptomyces sp. NPDC005859 TaxID=3157170 RepID=UPI0033D52218
MLQTETREPTEFTDGHEATTAATDAAATTDAPADHRELFFQRCRWCATTAYRRSFCRACGSTAFTRARSAGSGIVVRRNGHVPLNTWFVAMDEGFHLLCQVTGSAPIAVSVGARVSVVRPVGPHDQGLPLVELTHPAPPLERWW